MSSILQFHRKGEEGRSIPVRTGDQASEDSYRRRVSQVCTSRMGAKGQFESANPTNEASFHAYHRQMGLNPISDPYIPLDIIHYNRFLWFYLVGAMNWRTMMYFAGQMGGRR